MSLHENDSTSPGITSALDDSILSRVFPASDAIEYDAAYFASRPFWTEAEYLALHTNRLIEFVDGRIEALPMPTEFHQGIVAYLYRLLFAFTVEHAPGVVRFSLKVRLWEGRIREPDIVYLSSANEHLRGRHWSGADLAMEVVSDSNPTLDRLTKREEYARAKVQEYWIVDLPLREIVVLTLEGDAYREFGTFGVGGIAQSVLLPGFAIDVDEMLDAGTR